MSYDLSTCKNCGKKYDPYFRSASPFFCSECLKLEGMKEKSKELMDAMYKEVQSRNYAPKVILPSFTGNRAQRRAAMKLEKRKLKKQSKQQGEK